MKIKSLLLAMVLLVPLTTGSAVLKQSVHVPKNELYCLAQNIYHESRGEPLRGQLAVALVTLNRKKSGKYPKTICGVVYQPNQFSWTKDRSKRKAKIPFEFYLLAQEALSIHDFTRNSIYFHNTSIRPNWKARRTAKIGNHVFYTS